MMANRRNDGRDRVSRVSREKSARKVDAAGIDQTWQRAAEDEGIQRDRTTRPHRGRRRSVGAIDDRSAMSDVAGKS